MQLIILGMHRSGTSSVAGLLHLMGAYFAPEGMEMSSQPDNPGGFWERRDVMELNDDILGEAAGSWYQVSTLSLEGVEAGRNDEFSARIHAVVEEMNAHRPWMLKDPRFCLLLPRWLPFLDRPLCIHVYRNPLQIAHSLSQRNNFSLSFGLALWEFYSVTALNASRGLPRIRVCYEDLVNDPEGFTRNLRERLEAVGVTGLKVPSSDKLGDLIKSDLFHNRQGTDGLPEHLNSRQLELARRMKDGTLLENRESLPVSEGALGVLGYSQEAAERVDGLLSELERRKNREARFAALSGLLGRNLESIFHSRSWKLSSGVVRILDRITSRPEKDSLEVAIRSVRKICRTIYQEAGVGMTGASGDGGEGAE